MNIYKRLDKIDDSKSLDESSVDSIQQLIDEGKKIFIKLRPEIMNICKEYEDSKSASEFDPALWGELPDEGADDYDMLMEYYGRVKQLLIENGVHPAVVKAMDEYFDSTEYFKYDYLFDDFDYIDTDDVELNLDASESLTEDNTSHNFNVDKNNFNFALWVSGEFSAIYRELDAAKEAFENLKGQGFDLRIVDLLKDEIIDEYNY